MIATIFYLRRAQVLCHGGLSCKIFNFFFRTLSQSFPKLIHRCFILVYQNFFYVFLTKCGIRNSGISFGLESIDTSSVDFFFSFSQSKREVDRRLEELRDHYERGNAETERKLRRELKKTKALLRDAQAVIETQVSCRPHSIPLSHLPWCLL